MTTTPESTTLAYVQSITFSSKYVLFSHLIWYLEGTTVLLFQAPFVHLLFQTF